MMLPKKKKVLDRIQKFQDRRKENWTDFEFVVNAEFTSKEDCHYISNYIQILGLDLMIILIDISPFFIVSSQLIAIFTWFTWFIHVLCLCSNVFIFPRSGNRRIPKWESRKKYPAQKTEKSETFQIINQYHTNIT